ncbi:MAG: hypothetical protein KGQ59_01270 [Bdellovibrionales bacterium]|nr:hypothetical protein [Bdellovibrionales bacterium]
MSASINLVTLSGWVAKNPTAVGESQHQFAFQLVQHPYQPTFRKALEAFDDCIVATIWTADEYVKEILKQGDHVVVSGRLLPEGQEQKNVDKAARVVIWGISVQRSEHLEQLKYVNRKFPNGFDARQVEPALAHHLKINQSEGAL